MLKLFAAMAPPVALLLVGVMLLEPPALTPRQRVPTLRLLTGTGTLGPVSTSDPGSGRDRRPQAPTGRDDVLEPEPRDTDDERNDENADDEKEEDDNEDDNEDDDESENDLGGVAEGSGGRAASSAVERNRPE